MECNYIFEGHGQKTIIFIHGLSDNLDYWMKLSSSLLNEYKILRYDLRGHGKTEFSKFTMDDLVNDLYELISILDIKNPTLIGLSLGGNIALEFAIKYPEIVENLVIMSSFSEVDLNLKNKFLNFKKAINVSYEEFFDVIIWDVLPEDIIEKNYELLQEIKLIAAQNINPCGIKQGIEIGMRFNVTDDLDKIGAPTLILAGSDDEIATNHLQLILKDNIQNSNLVIFENTRHDLLIGDNISEILGIIRQLV